LRSTNPLDNPIIKANYLSDKEDQDLIIKGLCLVCKIASQSSIVSHIISEVRPGLEIKDDYGLLDYARRNEQTSWHAISTCRMGKSKMDVVNYKL